MRVDSSIAVYFHGESCVIHHRPNTLMRSYACGFHISAPKPCIGWQLVCGLVVASSRRIYWAVLLDVAANLAYDMAIPEGACEARIRVSRIIQTRSNTLRTHVDPSAGPRVWCIKFQCPVTSWQKAEEGSNDDPGRGGQGSHGSLDAMQPLLWSVNSWGYDSRAFRPALVRG